MVVFIVGGGKMGRYLAKFFLEKEYRVTMIEQNIKKCRRISKELDINIMHGDGSEAAVLKKAGIEEADVVLAVTEDDHDNLAICQLAERQFGVARTFTAVNTPGNEKLFEWLGVNVAVSPSSILAALVDRKISIDDITTLVSLPVGDLKMLEITINEGAPVAGKKLKKIDLPMEAILVTILRGNDVLVPRGSTVLKNGDVVIALTDPAVEDELIERLNGMK